MKHSILFSIFSVAMIVGFSSSGWGKSECYATDGASCNTGNNGGQQRPSSNPNQQINYIALECPKKCAASVESGGACGVAGCDCGLVGINTDAGGVKEICTSAQWQTACGTNNLTETGACKQAVKVSDANSPVDPNGLGQQGQICNNDVESAESTCDPNKSADVGMVMQMATGAQQALSMAAGSSIAAACGKLGKVSEAASAATATYKGYCTYAYSRCQKSCNDALAGEAMNNPTETAAVNRLLKRCKGMQQNIAEASNAVLGLLATKINMDQCKDQVVDCNLNPLAPSCVAAADCTNTTVATTNLVCICQSNPTDSRCGGGSSANLAGGIGGPAGLSSSGSTTDGTLSNLGLGDGGYGTITPPGAGTGSNQQPQNLAAGMQGGHNLGNTGGVNNAYTPPGAAGSGNGSKAAILSGYYGGSGMGGFGSGSSGSGSGGYGGYPGVAGSGNGKGSLDLKQFLPGGAKDPSRGIAGISGPDGITGPNSDIWQKVNTRYNAKSQGGAFLP